MSTQIYYDENLKNKLQSFIQKYRYLFRDVKITDLSLSAIVARIIDYWNLQQLKELYNLIWEENFKKAFLDNLIDKDWKVRDRININDYKMIYLLAHRLKLNDKIPLWDIIRKAKAASSFNLKSGK